MIIVEGVDNTGKSRLIETLVTVFPMLKVGKFDKAPEASENDYRNYVWGILGQSERQTQFYLYDRFLFSELIYGPILRGKMRLTDNEIVAAMRLLKYHKPLVIYCDRTEDQIRETFGEREQLNGVEDNLIPLMANYHHWMKAWDRQQGKLINYNFEEPKASLRVIGAVADYIRGVYDIDFINSI